MTTFHGTLEKLAILDKEARSWVSGPIYVTVGSSFLDDSPKIINLNETLGHRKLVPRPLNRNDSNCYWLPSTFSKNEDTCRQIEIIPLFVRACRDAKFKVCGCYEKDRNGIVFECIRSTINNYAKNQ